MTLEKPEVFDANMTELLKRAETNGRNCDITIARRHRTWRAVLILRTSDDLEIARREFHGPDLTFVLKALSVALENLP